MVRLRACVSVVACFAVLPQIVLAQDAAREPSAAGTDTKQATAESANASTQKPRDYLKFSEKLTSDCMLRRARLRMIANTHPSRAIRVVLVNYTGKTRSQGSSEKTLPAKSEPQPLGCDGTSGLERRWEIVSARFVDTKPSS